MVVVEVEGSCVCIRTRISGSGLVLWSTDCWRSRTSGVFASGIGAGATERDNKNLKEELGRVHTEVEGLGCLARETEERVGCRALEKGVGAALAHSVCPTAEVVVGTTFEVLDMLQGMMKVDFDKLRRRIIACGKEQP